MDQAGIIRDLLSWIEEHLDQPLSLDNVAAKAGYSKWHLQRMFKDVTGHAIGAYIRARRLSKSAVALRLTARPILDIALQYRFDSQQTFTRAFKKQFMLTPALYRRAPDWNSFGMRPPLRLGEFTMPKHEFVTLPEKHLVGVTQSYTCKLEEISEFRQQIRVQFWRDFLGNAPSLPPEMLGLHEPRPSMEKDDEQEVFYTTALTPEIANGHIQHAQPVKLEGGEYVVFNYEGQGAGIQDFILTLYGTCMPMLGLIRRQGQDIERYFPQKDSHAQDEPVYLRLEYMIPVRR
ncbi:MDR efflux pump AcrAB transcriptional activator RobA [Pluralibacter gergoviae]|uniref:MDR efflux pump AcrAB transcriptional activator RobA n=1 Tax=Pluralibacter gergoviae TaxID=61647 RepID=A0AAI9DIK4_PLUGE|nr:MDR efflux pump AcrAB transcriptional activator RobA [Pluralibacter gergoviae]EKV9906465.1 MDR efflux pump AcrAB transcriptional activator RobA [Pluralibacter gergoviae]EKW7275731.1 MDR efflux pump AcrAB transcriptional activator RobA [Pluralibacter gergoviae]ELD4295105.1 MDR efflux pump AcrAB transcriptional activator RobA [Pluralibacter gergoviae]ELD4306280.1 MDR efflux pump AcrAB transcriptional activator RobA [Pluralibacter gergoviae]